MDGEQEFVGCEGSGPVSSPEFIGGHHSPATNTAQLKLGIEHQP
jgi:hypothetical protein